jgi:hypothetical protein
MVDAASIRAVTANAIPDVLARFDALATPFVATRPGEAMRLRDAAGAARDIDGLRSFVADLRTRYGAALPADALVRLGHVDDTLGSWRTLAVERGTTTSKVATGAADARTGLSQALASAIAIEHAGGTAKVVEAGGLQAIDGAADIVGSLLLPDAIGNLERARQHLETGSSKVGGWIRLGAEKRSAIAHAGVASYRASAGQQLLVGLHDGAKGAPKDGELGRDMWYAFGASSGLYDTAQHTTKLFGRTALERVRSGIGELRAATDDLRSRMTHPVSASTDWLRGNVTGRAAALGTLREGSDLARAGDVHALEVSMVDQMRTLAGAWNTGDATRLAPRRFEELRPLAQQLRDTAAQVESSPLYAAMPEEQVAAISALRAKLDAALKSGPSTTAWADNPMRDVGGLVDRFEQSVARHAPDAAVSAESHPHEFALRGLEDRARSLTASPIDPADPASSLYDVGGALNDASRRAVNAARAMRI